MVVVVVARLKGTGRDLDCDWEAEGAFPAGERNLENEKDRGTSESEMLLKLTLLMMLRIEVDRGIPPVRVITPSFDFAYR